MTSDSPRRILLLVAAVAVVGYGALLFDSIGRGVGGSDTAGYACTARDILAGRIVVPIEALGRLDLEPPFGPFFAPLAHLPGRKPGTMVPFYPPGFPLQIAFAALITGWDTGPFVVNPVLALVTVVGTSLVARELSLSRPLAFAAAAMIAGCTVFLFCALMPLSDVAAAAWSTAAMFCALRARRVWIWAAAAGACFGMAVLVRPANALLVLPLALALPWRVRALVLFAAAGLPFALFYGAWNFTAFGSPWRIGYSHVLGELFAIENFGRGVSRYGIWVIAQFSPLVPLGWLVSAADRSLAVRDRAMLLVWFGSLFVFYCFWGPSDNWTYARFLLPGAPALVIAFLLALRDLARRVPGREDGPSGHRVPYRSLVVATVLCVVFVVERRVERRLHPLRSGRGLSVYPEACRRLSELAPDGKAVVVSMDYSAALRFYTDLIPLRWDTLGTGNFATLRTRIAAKGYRILAVVFPYEIEKAAAAAPGAWRFVENVGMASIWELPPD